MDKVKSYMFHHFEQILVLCTLLSVLFAHYAVYQKMAFLNFYYIPVLLAGFFLGRRAAVLFSFFCVLLVGLFYVAVPNFFAAATGDMGIELGLLFWGSFIMVTAYVTGTLFMHKERCLEDLRIAYIGVVEILSKYLESADRYTKGHSIRVANCATEIAIAMELPRLQIENIKAAALLHDIGKVEVSMNLIKKASILSDEEKKIVDTHADKGAKILNSVGSVLKEAVPIVLCHHIRYEQMEVEGSPFLSAETKMGACIVAVADAYDAITSDRPYRAGKTPLQAMEEIERAAGKQFHPEVVEAFRRIFGVLTAEREDEGVALTI